EDGRRWRAASGRAGRRLLGPELPVQIRYQTAADRQGLRLRRRADFRGSEEHPVSERHDARLQGITDAVGLRVRESECDEELRLRDVVFGLSFHPQNMPQDYFAFLELPRNLAIDAKDLEKKFYALSRQLHPDMHSRKSQAERDQAEESTAILNDAYRTLRDPITRAEYLLKLEGFDTSEQTSKDVPPELLEEVFELNMALEELRGGDTDVIPQLAWARERFDGMRDELDREMHLKFEEWDASHGREALTAVRQLLNRRKYIT